MNEAFWHERWARNEIGFHLGEVNPYLLRHWPSLALPNGARVLVPLCGKSLDMAWLVEQGFTVVGVELSEKAVRAFLTSNGWCRRWSGAELSSASSPAGWKYSAVMCSPWAPQSSKVALRSMIERRSSRCRRRSGSDTLTTSLR